MQNASCPLDAGIPSDFTDWPTAPDNAAKTCSGPNAAVQKMIEDVRWCYEGSGHRPDKLGVANCLTLAGHATSDIIENIDDVMRGLA